MNTSILTHLGSLLLLCQTLSLGRASTFGPTHAMAQTFHQPDGNRVVTGETLLPNLSVIDIPLLEEPRWLVGAPFENGAIWVAVGATGTVQSFKTSGTTWRSAPISPSRLPQGTPPLLQVLNDQAELIALPPNASRLSHPIIVGTPPRITYLSHSGDLVINTPTDSHTLPVRALPDARIITDGQHRLAILTGPTDEYRHGVLGDRIEARSITLVATQPQPQIERVIPIPSPWVIEGIAPIWADLDGDGQRELIVTLSSQNDGGKIVAFNEEGQLVAEGPGIGRGFRWRNQMAVAPYGPKGTLELSAVRTPHIGGTVEFYRMIGTQLKIVASLPGFTSHVIGSRNLDLNVTGRFQADAQPILLVPNNRRTILHGIKREADQATTAFELPIGGVLATNPAGVPLPDGSVTVGIGRQDGWLRIWSPSNRLSKLTLKPGSDSDNLHLTIHGKEGAQYSIQSSPDLKRWDEDRNLILPTSSDRETLVIPRTNSGQRFYRVGPPLTPPAANILSVQTSGPDGAYTFAVTIESPDTDCHQYANWWEVIDEHGTLLYRRILLHSHEHEQPFTRSGGPVLIPPSQMVWIRAHMKPGGYGGTSFFGSVHSGFSPAKPPKDFALNLAKHPPLPLPTNCE